MTAHNSALPEPANDPELAVGTHVEVRNRLNGEWARGFEIVRVDIEGYRLRRLSDGGELPLAFGADDVRKEKKRGMWWY
jgi:hypothetical protein